MTVHFAVPLRATGAALASAMIGLPAAWGTLALWYRLPFDRPARQSCAALWAGCAVALLIELWLGPPFIGMLTFACGFTALWVWWRRVPATNDKVWADDVARISSGTITGSRVTLCNVRNFDWRSGTDYEQRWETRTYDLDLLISVDMIMSYWRGPSIAHMLISFGFEGAEYVTFSVEVRRGKSQDFSEVGGFFKDFELSIIAADERDVIRLRTNIRGEEDYLYRLCIPVSNMRSLFLGYVAEANQLVHTPRFYNTVTVNCTTLVYHMMKRIVGHLPIDYRLLFSGYLPAYVYKVGGLDRRYPLSELERRGRITERARQADRSPTFSSDIRRGVPDCAIPKPAAARTELKA